MSVPPAQSGTEILRNYKNNESMCLERALGSRILLTSLRYLVEDSPGNLAVGRPRR